MKIKRVLEKNINDKILLLFAFSNDCGYLVSGTAHDIIQLNWNKDYFQRFLELECEYDFELSKPDETYFRLKI